MKSQITIVVCVHILQGAHIFMPDVVLAVMKILFRLARSLSIRHLISTHKLIIQSFMRPFSNSRTSPTVQNLAKSNKPLKHTSMSSSSSSSPAAPPAAANFTAGFISQRKTSTTTNKKHPRIKRALATVWFAFSLVLVQLVTFNGRNWADYFHDTTIHDVMDESTRVNTRQLQLVETSPLSSNDTIAFPNNDSQISAVESTLLVEKSPVVCTGTEDGSHSHQQCCGTWDVDTDDWWTQKPDWEVTEENRTHFCYAPMKDRAQAAFLRHVHERQWTSNNCSLVENPWKSTRAMERLSAGLPKPFGMRICRTNPFKSPIRLVAGSIRRRVRTMPAGPIVPAKIHSVTFSPFPTVHVKRPSAVNMRVPEQMALAKRNCSSYGFDSI